MVLEAGRQGCAEEVIVIAAALSIQDPRERPVEKREAANQQHARFADPGSDFLAFLNLWRYLRERQEELSGNQFRKACKAEFLHYLRVREWQDLVSQLRQAAKSVGIKLHSEPAEPVAIHTALLSGLLSHVGMRDGARREYAGARNASFTLSPGSSLSRKQPSWVMVSELVDTGRLWGHTAAKIEPAWVEPLAEHLVNRSYSEPRWDRERAQIVATERVLLYGLPIVAGRTVGYARIDPPAARELFIRRALVEGDWDTKHEFVAHNERAIEEVEALEARTRRRDILVDDAAIFAFYDERIPADVVSGAHFDRWWREARRSSPALLNLTRELLTRPETAGAVDESLRPARWRQGELEFELSYHFEPGSARDGVTVHVPLERLAALRPDGFDWLVPAFREELVTTLIRGLPKHLRRPLVPIPDTVAQLLPRLRPRSEPLLDALARELEALRGVRVARSDWDLSRLPAHLRMTFRVVDERGRSLGEGSDLESLRASLRPRLRAQLASATSDLEQQGLRAWTIGDLPSTVTLPGTGGAVTAYPALVDDGDSVSVRVLDTPAAQRASMHAGTRRLLALTVPSPRRSLLDRAQLDLATAPHGSVGAAIDDAILATIDSLLVAAGGPAFDRAGFEALRGRVAAQLPAQAATTVAALARVLAARRAVQARLDALPVSPAFAPARADVARQLGRLVYPGFVLATGPARLGDVERYLRAAERRLERLPDTVAVDRDRMNGVHELEALHERALSALPPGVAMPSALRDARWLLEELRVSHFAQALGVKGQVSSKRIRRLLADAVSR